MPQLDPKILAEIERKRALMNPRGFKPLSISPYDGSPLYQEGVGYLKNEATDVGNVPRGFGLPPMHQPPAPNSRLGFFNYLPQTRGRNQQFRDYYSRLQPASITSPEPPQPLLAGTNRPGGLLGYMKIAEGLPDTFFAGSGFYSDPKKGKTQENYGYGSAATKRVKDLVKAMTEQGYEKQEIADAVLQASLQEHKLRARKIIGEKLFDKQPQKVQELLTELEYNTGNLGGSWTKLKQAVKDGNYQVVEQEMYNAEKNKDGIEIQGMERRNNLREAYFGGDSGAIAPELAQDSAQQPPKGISAMPKPDAAYRQSQQQPMQSLSAQDLFNRQFQQDVQVPQKGISAMPKPSFIPKGISAMPKPDVGYVQSQQAPQGSYSQSGGMFTPEQMAMMVAQSQAYGKNTGLV